MPSGSWVRASAGTPRAQPSRKTFGMPSKSDVLTTATARSMSSPSSDRGRGSSSSTLSSASARRCICEASAGARGDGAADHPETRIRQSRRQVEQGARVLVGVQSPDPEERLRLSLTSGDGLGDAGDELARAPERPAAELDLLRALDDHHVRQPDSEPEQPHRSHASLDAPEVEVDHAGARVDEPPPPQPRDQADEGGRRPGRALDEHLAVELAEQRRDQAGPPREHGEPAGGRPRREVDDRDSVDLVGQPVAEDRDGDTAAAACELRGEQMDLGLRAPGAAPAET